MESFEKWKELVELKLKEHGLEKLGTVRSSSGLLYLDVKYSACGHSRRISTSRLVRDVVGTCKECYEKNLKDKYEKQYDIEILSVEPDTCRKIKFNSCGHTRIITLSNLKSGSFKCIDCLKEKFIREAEESGLEYIRPDETTGSGKKKKHLYLASCGHVLSLRSSHVRVGHWTCRTCNSGYLDRSNFLYLFKVKANDGFEFVKLGYSMKPEYRKYDYVFEKGTEIELVKKVKVPTGKEAISLENEIHSKYSQFNINKNIMKNYFTESGFTECYPVNLLGSILSELNKVEEIYG